MLAAAIERVLGRRGLNILSKITGLVLAGGTTFVIAGREDGGAYYQASYTSPTYNRVLNLPNADVATLVVGQPVTLTKIGGTGALGHGLLQRQIGVDAGMHHVLEEGS